MSGGYGSFEVDDETIKPADIVDVVILDTSAASRGRRRLQTTQLYHKGVGQHTWTN
jgi:hypothetical protein